MAQNYNINVRLSSFTGGKATSAHTSSRKKKYKTSTAEYSPKFGGFQRPNKPMGLGGLKTMGVGLLVLTAIKSKVAKSAHTMNRAVGTVTNNRYREKKNRQTVDAVLSPIDTFKDMMGYTADRHFEVLRENKMVDRERRLSGNALPYQKDGGGLSL